jgi:hypothetical protein
MHAAEAPTTTSPAIMHVVESHQAEPVPASSRPKGMNARAGHALAAVAVLLLAGCGPTGSVDGVAATVPPERLLDCPPTTVGETLPADATPTAVLRCDRRDELVPGDGEWTFDVRSRATAGLDRLVTALRLPSEQMANELCTAELRLPTVVLLEFDTHLLPVVTPKDECAKTRPEVLAAYEALTWTEVTRTRVAQTRSEAAVAAGCERWKDVLAIEAPTARPGGPGDGRRRAASPPRRHRRRTSSRPSTPPGRRRGAP